MSSPPRSRPACGGPEPGCGGYLSAMTSSPFGSAPEVSTCAGFPGCADSGLPTPAAPLLSIPAAAVPMTPQIWRVVGDDHKMPLSGFHIAFAAWAAVAFPRRVGLHQRHDVGVWIAHAAAAVWPRPQNDKDRRQGIGGMVGPVLDGSRLVCRGEGAAESRDPCRNMPTLGVPFALRISPEMRQQSPRAPAPASEEVVLDKLRDRSVWIGRLGRTQPPPASTSSTKNFHCSPRMPPMGS